MLPAGKHSGLQSIGYVGLAPSQAAGGHAVQGIGEGPHQLLEGFGIADAGAADQAPQTGAGHRFGHHRPLCGMADSCPLDARKPEKVTPFIKFSEN